MWHRSWFRASSSPVPHPQRHITPSATEEVKLDEYRALAVKSGAGVTLFSRRRKSLNRQFPHIVEALADLPEGTVVDGELVALNDSGRRDFNLLQNFRAEASRIYYYVFDLLCWRDRDLTLLPLVERRALLKSLVVVADKRIRTWDYVEAAPKDLLSAVRQQGLEGIIGKQKDSHYQPGKRSGAWIKHRVNRGQEFVIGGYFPGPHGFDSLIVGLLVGNCHSLRIANYPDAGHYRRRGACALLFSVFIAVNSSPLSPTSLLSSVPFPSNTTLFTFFYIAEKLFGMSPEATCGISACGAMNSMYKARVYISSGCRQRVRYEKNLPLFTSSMVDCTNSTMELLTQARAWKGQRMRDATLAWSHPLSAVALFCTLARGSVDFASASSPCPLTVQAVPQVTGKSMYRVTFETFLR